MLLRTRLLALQTGYDIVSDLPYGFTLALGKGRGAARYRFLFNFHFGWPVSIWSGEDWNVGEPGFLPGLPILKAGVRSSAWTGRDHTLLRWYWPHKFTVTQDIT